MPIFSPSGASLAPLTSDGTDLTLASGQLLLPNGTKAAPTLAFAAAVGWYSDDAAAHWAEGGVSRFMVGSTGGSAIMRLPAASLFTWVDGADASTGTPDVGLSRTGAGVLRVNNGSTGYGVLEVGNTLNVVSPTSPNRTITLNVGGTTVYVHAKTTND